MKRATVISAAAFMLAASALSLTTVTPVAAHGLSDRTSDRAAREQLRELLGNRIRSREDLRDLIQDRLQEREALRDLLGDRLRGREDLRELLAERGGGRGDLRELLAERGGGRDDLRERLADRIGGRGDLRDFSVDRMERRGHIRDLIRDRLEGRTISATFSKIAFGAGRTCATSLPTAWRAGSPARATRRDMHNRGDAAGDLVSNRFEGGEENTGGTAGINREDLRDLILDRIRNRGDVDQLLEQIHDRIGGED